MTTYYKVLAEDGSAHHGGSGKWPLPAVAAVAATVMLPFLNLLHSTMGRI